MVRTQIQLTRKQAAVLKRLAAVEGVSMAELVRRGVDCYIKAVGGVSQEEIRRRAIKAAGRFASGQRDLSEHHDRYLAKAYGR